MSESGRIASVDDGGRLAGAVVFDFDGLVLDTESVVFEANAAMFRHFALEPIPIDEWRTLIGLSIRDPNHWDPLERLVEAGRNAGVEIDRRVADEVRHEWNSAHAAQLTPMPGVVERLDEAAALGLPTAIASSSTSEWVLTRLDDAGLRDRFEYVSCAGNGVPGKPAPDVYVRACAAVGAATGESVAFDDSPVGVRGAVAAGLWTIAVPSSMTAPMDFSHADARVDSLLDLRLADIVVSRR